MKKKTMGGMQTYLDNSVVNMSRHKQVQMIMNDFNHTQKKSTKQSDIVFRDNIIPLKKD